MLIPSPSLETPNYDVQRIRKDETISSESSASYQMAKAAPEPETSQSLQAEQPGPEVPAVTSVKPALYVAMGWLIVVKLDTLLTPMPQEGVMWLLIG